MSERRVTFRNVLIRWLLVVSAMVGIPGALVEATRPWTVLSELVRTAEGISGSAAANIDPADLARMNAFALELTQHSLSPPDAAPGAGWVMLVSGPVDAETARALAPEADVQAVLRSAAQWQSLLDSRPDGAEILASFRRARGTLTRALATGSRVDLAVADVYMTLDTGLAPAGYFQDNIAFVAGAGDWWSDPLYPGEPFNVTEIGGEFWRASYLPELGGEPGSFGHNPYHDPILPRFERDQWGTWFSVWSSLEPAPGQYNTVTMDIDAEAVIEEMWRAVLVALSLVFGLGGLTAVVSNRVASRVSQPVAALQTGAQAVMAGDYTHVVPPMGEGELGSLIDTFNRMIRLLMERVNLLGTLEKLVGRELAQTAAREGLSLGGREVNATMMFTDFAGFSTITQSMQPVDVVDALNAYFSVLVPLIQRHGGLPDKYIGDAIVAVFGAPVTVEDHADRAVRCAIDMQRAMRTLNESRRKAGKVVFEMRVGLNTGQVVAGAIGCDEKLEFTTIGESTNLANRMEAACPIGHMQLSSSTFAALKRPPEGVRPGPIEAVRIKGYEAPVQALTLWLDGLRVEKTGDGAAPYRYSQAPPTP